jgi:hypothetical protein
MKGDSIMSTKVILGATVALAAALASPAFAQSTDVRRDAYATYVQPYERAQTQDSANPAWDVYGNSGHYVGSDPDPFIRGELERDHPRLGSE